MTSQEVGAEYERRREQGRIGLASYLAAYTGIKETGLRVMTGRAKTPIWEKVRTKGPAV